VERNDSVNVASELCEFVCGLIDVGANFKFTLVVEKVNAVHFAIAFSATVTAIIADFKVFFAADLTATCF
jgi:hypothetical protein